MTLSRLANEAGEQDLMQQISEEVRLVEEELARQVSSQVSLVAQIGAHTLQAGGKRLRPAFVSLSARATGLPYDPERARLLGACMEMIHMATLVHDDVIDHAATRRGRPTASAVFGNTGAILTGDVLLSKAMSILARDGDLRIIRRVSDAVVEMAEGEVRELELRGRFDVSEEEHLRVLRMKTAAFIESCCVVGALVAGASEEVLEALRAYGHHVGLAFQIVDDLLDYRGSSLKTGKPVATDFTEGCATLPLIYLTGKLSDRELGVVSSAFGHGVTDEILGWMADRGAFTAAEKAARGHLEAAVSEIEGLPSSSAKCLLMGVAEFVLSREL